MVVKLWTSKYNNKIFFFFCLFRATPVADGGSQAGGPIRAVAEGLCHRPSNARSKPCLQSAPQLMAMPDPYPTEQGQGSNLQRHGSQLDSLTTEPWWELQENLKGYGGSRDSGTQQRKVNKTTCRWIVIRLTEDFSTTAQVRRKKYDIFKVSWKK